MELLAGNTLYDASGRLLWVAPLPDGLTAVADFDADGDPEIVLASPPGMVYLLDHLGNQLGSPHVLGGGWVAQPVIADVDGDGAPDVIATNGRELQALEWTGTGFAVKWRQPVVDVSGTNGAVAYDFDGDGASEVLYHDEYDFYIFDGRTGTVLSKIPFVSNTLGETPVVANINNDCEPEILIAGCRRRGPNDNSVIAYQCSGSVPARPIWNQYGYHATNVNDDGTIPRFEAPSWTAQNSWLGQVENSGIGGPAADAGPPQTICVGESATLDASGSLPCDTSGLEYRWLQGATVICPWSTTPTCDVTPSTTTTYTLEVSCLGSPSACVTTDDTTVFVIVEPDLVPPDIGNALRMIRFDSNVAMSWVSVPNARTYNLYRGTAKGVWPPPLLPGLPAPTWTLPDVPGPPNLYFYRVSGVSCSGLKEGP